MKKAAYIVIIIDMILFCWCITPLIFCPMALKKLKNCKGRPELTPGFSVCMLIFGSTVGGVFMLCMTEEQAAVPLFAKEGPVEPVKEPEPTVEAVEIPEDIVLPELIADIINVEQTVKFSRKEDIRIFQERLYKSSADLKRRYAMIDSDLYAIDRARVNYSSKYQTFKAGQTSIAKLTVKNEAIYVYLALDPKAYKGSRYTFRDVSDSSAFSAYPMLLKVTTDEQAEDVRALIADIVRVNA